MRGSGLVAPPPDSFMILPYRCADHVRHHGAADSDGAEQVDRDRLDPFVPVDLLDRAHRTVDAGVVDQDVEPAEPRIASASTSASTSFRLDDVGPPRCMPSARADGRQSAAAASARCVARAQHDAGALGDETVRRWRRRAPGWRR